MSTNEIHNTFSAEETRNLGKKLAQELRKGEPSYAPAELRKGKAFVLALKGDLGGGKTTFLQGFAKGLGIKEKILSPTFVIMKRFEIKYRNIGISEYRNFYHIDCYRIKSPKDISELGLKEIISNPKNIVAIEWAERIKSILPKNTLWLEFVFKDKDKRVVLKSRI